MKKLLLSAFLAAALASPASAQSFNFYGCGDFSCHQVTGWIDRVDQFGVPVMKLKYNHYFTEAGFFNIESRLPSPIRIRPGIFFSRAGDEWDGYGFETQCTFFRTCLGAVNGRELEGRVDNFVFPTSIVVNVYRASGRGDPRDPDWEVSYGPLNTVALQVVPEPSTYALFAVGLAGIVWIGRRRRSSST